MTFATVLTAVAGYVLVYAALPNRVALRARSSRRTRLLLGVGIATFIGSAVVGAVAFGSVLGPLVALTVASTAGSVLALVAPLFAPADGRAERTLP